MASYAVGILFNIGKAGSGLLSPFTKVFKLFGSLAVGFSRIIYPIGLVIGLFVAFKDTVVDIYNIVGDESLSFGDKVKGILISIGEGIFRLADFYTFGLLGAIVAVAKGGASGAESIVASIKTTITSALKTIAQKLKEITPTIVAGIKDLVPRIKETLKSGAAGLGTFLGGAIRGAFETGSGGPMSEIFGSIGELASAAFDAMYEVGLSFVTEAVPDFIVAISKQLGVVPKNFSGTFSEALEFILPSLGGLMNEFTMLLGQVTRLAMIETSNLIVRGTGMLIGKLLGLWVKFSVQQLRLLSYPLAWLGDKLGVDFLGEFDKQVVAFSNSAQEVVESFSSGAAELLTVDSSSIRKEIGKTTENIKKAFSFGPQVEAMDAVTQAATRMGVAGVEGVKSVADVMRIQSEIARGIRDELDGSILAMEKLTSAQRQKFIAERQQAIDIVRTSRYDPARATISEFNEKLAPRQAAVASLEQEAANTRNRITAGFAKGFDGDPLQFDPREMDKLQGLLSALKMDAENFERYRTNPNVSTTDVEFFRNQMDNRTRELLKLGGGLIGSRDIADYISGLGEAVKAEKGLKAFEIDLRESMGIDQLEKVLISAGTEIANLNRTIQETMGIDRAAKLGTVTMAREQTTVGVNPYLETLPAADRASIAALDEAAQAPIIYWLAAANLTAKEHEPSFIGPPRAPDTTVHVEMSANVKDL